MFPENYSLSNEPEFCLRCGLSFKNFLKFGKIHCAHCFESFRTAIVPYKKIENKYQRMRLISFLKNEKMNFVETEEAFPEPEKKIFKKCVKEFQEVHTLDFLDVDEKIFSRFPSSNLRFRYRVARNFRGLVYRQKKDQFDEQVISRLKTVFFQSKRDFIFPKEKMIQIDPYTSVRLFDEDHIRFEIFSQVDGFYKNLQKSSAFLSILGSRSIFDDHAKIGFLTSCPTNMGRGNKISCYVDLQSFTDQDLGMLQILMGNSFDWKREIHKNNRKVRLYLYKKNIRPDQIRLFYRYLYLILLFDEYRKILK